ncbi:hypothetical protein, partial [Bacillus coahuilensis]|uniref:hypothetical protein n=1 Tax=Bacillus coahuilensis TaxID=408580 RepID=UPI003B830041
RGSAEKRRRKGEERRASLARCRKEEKEARRAPREPSAVQKRGRGSKKSAARAWRGAEKRERKQEELPPYD